MCTNLRFILFYFNFLAFEESQLSPLKTLIIFIFIFIQTQKIC